jgi:hypothetical protein
MLAARSPQEVYAPESARNYTRFVDLWLDAASNTHFNDFCFKTEAF